MSEEEIKAEEVVQEPAKESDPTAERDARCVPAALAIVRLIGSFEGHMLTEQDKSKSFEAYNGLAQEAMKILLAANIPVGEANYVFQLIKRPQDEVSSILFESLNKHLYSLQEKAFGCRLPDMRLADLHAKLGGDIVE